MWKRRISGRNSASSDGTRLAPAPRVSQSVYLFVRTPPDGPTSAVALRRLKALQELRDELRHAGVIIAAAPRRAKLQVEITNVFASDDGARARDGRRVIVVRLSVGGERMDFVCADGHRSVSAERQAADRICVWLESLDNRPVPRHRRLPDALTVTPSNC